MEGNLFAKYKHHIDTRNSFKRSLVLYIKDVTGVIVDESCIEVTGMKIHLNITSVQKNKLHKKHIQDLLGHEGYTLSY